MAKVQKRTWLSRGATGHRVRKVSWGYTLQVDGKQERVFKAEWTREGAQNALAERLLERDTSKAPAPATGTFGEAVDRYLKAKSRKKSIKDDQRHLVAFTASFGADMPLGEITAARISAWKADRLAAECPQTKAPYSAAAINRPLAALRHLLQLAHEEWQLLPAVPKIRLEKEPQGRIRWLEPDEEARLLDACRTSKNRQLAPIVTVALESGLRKGELLGLSWDRVDLSRGVLRLEITKSGKRREVPMRQAVYDILAGLPSPRTGRVWPKGKIRTAWENAVEEAKLDDFHFHDCRHHFASWFVMRGGSLQALKEILGHADYGTTLRYAHLAPEHLRQEVAKTERAMTPTFSTSSAHGVAGAVHSGVAGAVSA
jgi:integrase